MAVKSKKKTFDCIEFKRQIQEEWRICCVQLGLDRRGALGVRAFSSGDWTWLHRGLNSLDCFLDEEIPG